MEPPPAVFMVLSAHTTLAATADAAACNYPPTALLHFFVLPYITGCLASANSQSPSLALRKKLNCSAQLQTWLPCDFSVAEACAHHANEETSAHRATFLRLFNTKVQLEKLPPTCCTLFACTLHYVNCARGAAAREIISIRERT